MHLQIYIVMNDYEQLLKHHGTPIMEEVLNRMNLSKVVMPERNTSERIPLTLDNLAEAKAGLQNPCLYRWCVPCESEITPKLLALKFDLPEKRTIGGEECYVLYFGKSVKGERRILKQHLRGTARTSTIRHTLYGIVFPGEAYQEAKEKEIDCLLAGTFFQWLPFEGEKATEYVVAFESVCIALGNYLLNIEGNTAINDKWRKQLLDARKTSKKPK